MDVLTHIFTKGADMGVLSSFKGISAMKWVSIYADDVALFAKPSVEDLTFVRTALGAFGRASGLRVNYHKSYRHGRPHAYLQQGYRYGRA